MAYSYVRYTSNGTTTNYTFAFPYISSDHIKVRVDGTLVTNWSFLNSSTVQFVSAPVSGKIIEIRRETPKDSPIVNFTDGSVLLERDLDLLAVWELYLAQETQDGLDASISLSSTGVWDAKNARITNLANPVNAQDAATKAYADGVTSTVASQVTAAQNAATAAAASDFSAQGWAISAASSAASAATLLDNFDDRYLGPKASDPTVDNDGNALIVGTLYFNSTTGKMRVYTSSGWVDTSAAQAALMSTFEFVATAGQTVFSGADANGATLSYIESGTIVTLNGLSLRPGEDYTATNGTSITLISAAGAGDELQVVAFAPFAIASIDAYTKAEADAKYATLTGTYSKTASDAKYALLSDTYLKTQVYTKTESDTNYVPKTGAGAQTFAGVVESTSGGFKFPDGTTQTTAAAGSTTAGAVGTYAFALRASTTTFGTSVPGSSLTPSSSGGASGSTLTGTWRCMGYTDGSSPTLFVRIS